MGTLCVTFKLNKYAKKKPEKKTKGIIITLFKLAFISKLPTTETHNHTIDRERAEKWEMRIQIHCREISNKQKEHTSKFKLAKISPTIRIPQLNFECQIAQQILRNVMRWNAHGYRNCMLKMHPNSMVDRSMRRHYRFKFRVYFYFIFGHAFNCVCKRHWNLCMSFGEAFYQFIAMHGRLVSTIGMQNRW